MWMSLMVALTNRRSRRWPSTSSLRSSSLRARVYARIRWHGSTLSLAFHVEPCCSHAWSLSSTLLSARCRSWPSHAAACRDRQQSSGAPARVEHVEGGLVPLLKAGLHVDGGGGRPLELVEELAQAPEHGAVGRRRLRRVRQAVLGQGAQRLDHVLAVVKHGVLRDRVGAERLGAGPAEEDVVAAEGRVGARRP